MPSVLVVLSRKREQTTFTGMPTTFFTPSDVYSRPLLPLAPSRTQLVGPSTEVAARACPNTNAPAPTTNTTIRETLRKIDMNAASVTVGRHGYPPGRGDVYCNRSG